ncbi:sulfatase [soil metagenome]
MSRPDTNVSGTRGITRRDFLKLTAGGVAGLAVLGTTTMTGYGRASYLPEGGSRTNVVMVSLGNLRRDHVGAYGNDWIKTPNLDALTKESLRFTRPYPESLPTINARRAVYTGERNWPFRNWSPSMKEAGFPAGWQWIPEDQTSFTETLSDNGYSGALVTDTYYQFEASMNFQRGFSAFDFVRGQELDRLKPMTMVSEKEVDRYTVPGNSELSRKKVRRWLANAGGRNGEEDYFPSQVFRRSLDVLGTARDMAGPFFMVVDNFEPHEPWDLPEPYASMYGEPIGEREPTVPNYAAADYLEEDELRRMRELYAGSVTMIDHWFGEFMNGMEDLGLLDETLLIVFSEGGVSLGEHGYTGKVPRAIWPELTENVLYVRHPEGKRAGQTSDYRASFQDLAPTILGAAGVEMPSGGQDLGVILDGREPEQERPYFTLGYDNYSWAQDDDYALSVRNEGSEARLYDLREDPVMNENVASENRKLVEKMYSDYILRDAGDEPPPVY